VEEIFLFTVSKSALDKRRSFRGQSGCGVKLTNHFHPVPTLRMYEAISPLFTTRLHGLSLD
jgi:hypothetical protein